MIDDGALVRCAVDAFGTVAKAFEDAGYNVVEQKLVYEPMQTIDVHRTGAGKEAGEDAGRVRRQR